MCPRPSIGSLLVSALFLGSCADEPTGAGRQHDAESDAAPVEQLAADELAIRVSIALRGMRPTSRELERVRADPDALDALIDGWLASDALANTVMSMHAEQLRLQADTVGRTASPPLGPLAPWSAADIDRSLAEEPLQLIWRVVREGLPYTEIVTADWMMADAIVAAAYGVDHDPTGPDWQVSHWIDGRPHAGVLTSSHVLRTHVSMISNVNRARANFLVSDALLCEPIEARPVEVGLAHFPSTPEATLDAIWTDPACSACHQALDPLAAQFHGFRIDLTPEHIEDAHARDCVHEPLNGLPGEGTRYVDDACYPLRLYRPEDAQLWQELGLPAPSYYGLPAPDLPAMARQISVDPRFTRCAVQRFVSHYGQVPLEAVPAPLVDELLAGWSAAGLDTRALLGALVRSDFFRLRAGPEAAGLLALRPADLAREVARVTGFRYLSDLDEPGCTSGCAGTLDLLHAEQDIGLRTFLGGTDVKYHAEPHHGHTPLRALAVARIAAEASAWVVRTDLAIDDRGSRRLLHRVDGTERGGAAVRDQLAALHETTTGVAATPRELDQLAALFAAVIDDAGDVHTAWQVVIAALLRDPRFLTY